ncbi:MAG TPA: DUF5777 family beta-barrel protein [Chitinophagales bacterium]|nr:DUF5777 family beta-barrel protein [Chitinophagales bacterium]
MKSHFFSLKNLLLLIVLLASHQLYAQQSSSDSTKPKPKVVKATFEDAVLINNQTVQGPAKKSLELIFQHRFGVLKSADDLFGIFAPANIRFGFVYGVTSHLSLSIGATKSNRLFDVGGKYILIRQTAPHGIPVTVTYYGNVAFSALPEANFNNQDNEYFAANRLSFFNELMIAKKFNSHLSLQLAPTFTHYNIVDSLMEHNIIGVSFAGRYKFTAQSSLMVEFDYPITSNSENPQKPNLGIGYEISTGSHQFQVFLCSSDGILNQQIMMNNQNEFWKGKFLLGFNITRSWSF